MIAPVGLVTFDVTGLSESGIWIRRQMSPPSLADEAFGLAQVLQTWNLKRLMSLERYDGLYAEVSGRGMEPIWLYLIELHGRRTGQAPLISSHPLSHVGRNQPLRLVALVDPHEMHIPGALVESASGRRLIWMHTEPAST